jgi:RecA-family ATPase
VLYVNLELDRASCLHRFKDVYTTMKVKPNNLSKIDIWNLRGRSVPMDQLAPKLIRRAQKKNYIAIVIDPIYKVITGDENSADQMARFCNQFDKVCTELGCAVIYCHHHSKGSQSGKRSMDRASGSGVFARDPDALLDLTELEITESLRKQQEDKAACSVIYEWLARFGFAQDISQDDRVTLSAMQQIAHDKLQSASYSLMMQDIDKAKAAVGARTAWRIEGTFREFPKLPPLNLWFDYPIHRADEDEVLKDAGYEGDMKSSNNRKQKMAQGRQRQAEQQKLNGVELFIDAYNKLNIDTPPTMSDIVTFLGKAYTTVSGWAKNAGYVIDKNTHYVLPIDYDN